MHQHSHFNIPNLFLSYLKNKELDEFYLSVAMRSFAESFIGIFVPIYLYLLGLSIREIAFYYLVGFLCVGFFTYFGMIIVSKIGIKKTLAVGTVISIGYYISLYLVGQGLPYFIAALVWGIGTAIYYSGFHSELSKFTDRKNEGREYSFLKVIIIGATALGPVIGSLLIINFSFPILFLIVSLFLIFSSFPLFLSNDLKIKKPSTSFKEIITSDTPKMGLHYKILAILEATGALFWPLFIFIILGSILNLGIIITISSFITIFVVLHIGRLSDKKNKLAFGIGTWGSSISWVLRLISLVPFTIFLINFYWDIMKSFLEISFSKLVYQKAKKAKNLANYLVFREIHLTIGRVILLVLLIIVQSLEFLFIFCFFATFLLLFNFKKNKKV